MGEPLSQPPYGYMKDPQNPKRWVVEPEAAKVVREIFVLYLEGYGHWAKFTQDSKTVETDRGTVELENAVYRNAERKNQLYIPLDAVKLFDMRWAYAKRNNFILIEHESEDKPITEQP